ncbi:hypothetical protein F2Q70_00041722 [Brassica cretica]|uniref:Uncharacterized protein n=1 Tax=Brassica cretica TaxID=69181 RepID=A0A8S9K438_BRACR|nr:hypothetical protein F2Q70_00041722 [Brassica cretica]
MILISLAPVRTARERKIRHRRLLLFSCLFVFLCITAVLFTLPALLPLCFWRPVVFVSAAGELRVQRGMPGGWSLDAEKVWFRLVRSDFRVWQEAPLLLVGSIARGGGSAVSPVLLRLRRGVMVRMRRGESTLKVQWRDLVGIEGCLQRRLRILTSIDSVYMFGDVRLLGDESDITLRGLEAVKKSQKISLFSLLVNRATTHSDLVVRAKKRVKEPTFESLCRGGKKQYEQLLEVEQKRGDSVYSEETECVGFARLGAADQKILSGTMKQLESVDCGAPLNCLVIVGKTHPVEEEMLEFYKYGTAN